MSLTPSTIIASLIAFAALKGDAQPLGERQVQVTTTLAQSGARMAYRVRLSDQDDGSHCVEVLLTNESRQDVNLVNAEVVLPWAAPAADCVRVAAGATATGVWPPTLVADPAKDRGEPVSGMYLLAERKGGGYSLAAFLSWQTFWSKLRYRSGVLTVSADGEGRRIRGGETVALEKIRLADGANWQDLLFGYADAIARELNLPRKPARQWAGWSTWDYYGRGWTKREVEDNLAALQQLVPAANLLQIDGGWWRERGDFTGARDDLGPAGMKLLATDIRARGLTAGVHLDGMRASTRSVVARQHPDFFLHDRRGALLVETGGAGGDGPYVFFDYSRPETCDYMREALRRLRREWGYDYFKIDYLRAGIGEDLRRRVLGDDPRRAVAPFDPGLTSVERFHRALAAFRGGMGDDAYFVGCSTPFGPAFGEVDALRTGPDINPKFSSYRLDCEANGGNFYLNGRVVQVDSDYEVVRARADEDATLTLDQVKDGGSLTPNEAEMWTDYVALFGSIKLASDDLMILRDERKALAHFALAQPACTKFVPLDFWQRARSRTDAFNVFLGESGPDVLLVLFNWSDAPRTYRVSGIAPGSLRGDSIVRGVAETAGFAGGVRIAIAARHAAIFRLPPGTRFGRVRKTIAVE